MHMRVENSLIVFYIMMEGVGGVIAGKKSKCSFVLSFNLYLLAV